MKIIGITGNSGSGKSTISKMVQDKCNGIVIDADKIARNMACADSNYLKEIANVFGTDIISNNKLDRKKMADIIFNDKIQKEKMDKITFKYVVNEIKLRINLAKEQYDCIILDVPLLFESKLNEICDYTIGVIAKEEDKICRICKRDNINREKAIQRINSQPSDEFYINNCDYIINNSNIEEIRVKVNEMLTKLQ